MIKISQLKKEYFDKLNERPVKINPFDPKSVTVAKKYVEKLNKLLEEFNLKAVHRGSTYFKISGKGDIEIGIYPNKNNWDKTIQKLKTHYRIIGKIEEDYARFNDKIGQYEIEIILMKGQSAKIDKGLTRYLKNNPEILKKYERIKTKYSSSKKEYSIQKDKFFQRIIKQIYAKHNCPN